MIELIIAIVGGGYFLCKWFSYRYSEKLYDARKADAQVYIDKTDEYSDRGRAVVRAFKADPYAALDEIADNLQTVFGENWRDMFSAYPYSPNATRCMAMLHGFQSIWQAAYVIYLAKHGIAPDATYSLKMVMRLCPGDTGTQESKRYNLPVCHEIEKCIQAQHGERGFRLYYNQGYRWPALSWEWWLDRCGDHKRSRPW